MKQKKTTIAIVGLGYVGLPLAVRCCECGYNVVGFDLDNKKIKSIQKGKTPFKEKFVEERKEFLGKIIATDSPRQLRKADIVLVCVPTPVNKQFYPNLEPLRSAVQTVIRNRKPNQLIVIESTINPGVCEEVIEPLFYNADLKEGKDYFLAHCPERIDPGNKKWNVINIPRVVGSLSREGLRRAVSFYGSIIDGEIHPMRSIREAEAVKVVENSFRDINIAFVNELAKSFDQMNIDVKDVIEGAATKPFAFMPHFPGRGVGGHCIPVDPYYLIEQAKKEGFDHHLLRVAREVNNDMPSYTVELLQDLLNEIKLPMKGIPIGVMGLSYKANIDDLRESPSLKIIKELEKKKAKIIKYDPFIPKMSDVLSTRELLKKSKALIMVTDHSEFLELDEAEFKKYGIKAIVDGMNCLNAGKIKRLGIKYHGIGRK